MDTEKCVLFVGRSSYKDPERNDSEFLSQLIDKIKMIIEEKTKDIVGTNKNLHIELKDTNLTLSFSIVYDNGDLYPIPKIIKETGQMIEDELDMLVDQAFMSSKSFFYDIIPNCGTSNIFSFSIRPFKGTYTCPVFKRNIENDKNNYNDDN